MDKVQLLKQLKSNYRLIRVRCLCKDNKRYENVPIDPNWLTFDTFVKDNWIRYYRAIIKWKNYQRAAVRKKYKGSLVLPKIRLVRKIKELGYTKDNTVYTSPSDASKYRNSTHKYMFENKLLGTRDIKNILKKRGINITMETIVNRLNKQEDIFKLSPRKRIFYKNSYKSLPNIAKLENISYNKLKHNYKKTNNIKKAIKLTKTLSY